jgi:glycosyltransferase involved in cell wall biosynthesis
MADAQPGISVLVPFQNSAAHLERCIRALLGQDMPAERYEVILVDNNSTDASHALACRFSEVRIVTETKAGAYAARNRGVAEARGEIVVFTDADCAPDPAWLRRHSEVIAEPGVDVVLGSRRPACDSASLRVMMLYEETKASTIFSGTDKALYYGYTNNMAVRRRTLLELGCFREVMRGADSVFIRQLVERKGCRVVRYCPDAAITHLEITSLRRAYTKHLTYGRSNQRNSRSVMTCEPMSMRERWQTYRATVRKHSLGAADASLLLGVLVGGGISYEVGRLGGYFGSRG